jgi:hypothetical protein
MSEDKHDIGKILGCMLFALGSRDLLGVVHRMIVGSAMLHVPLFEMAVVGVGIGLYFHQAIAWGTLFSAMALCETFVLIVAIAIPVKLCLGYEVRPPGHGQYGGIDTFTQLYFFLVVYGSLFAITMKLLLTDRARRDFGVMQNDK